SSVTDRSRRAAARWRWTCEESGEAAFVLPTKRASEWRRPREGTRRIAQRGEPKWLIAGAIRSIGVAGDTCRFVLRCWRMRTSACGGRCWSAPS
ncbi:hypothetical protein X777_01773, partial [Ooceraea biroi]